MIRSSPALSNARQRLLARFPDAAMISGNASVIEAATGNPQAHLIVRLPQQEGFVSPQDYAARNRHSPVTFSTGSNTIRRDVYLALGGQDAELAWYADWFLYFSIGLSHGFGFTPTIYTTHRLGGERNYSGGRFDWRCEKPVLRACLRCCASAIPRARSSSRRLPSSRVTACVCSPLCWKNLTAGSSRPCSSGVVSAISAPIG